MQLKDRILAMTGLSGLALLLAVSAEFNTHLLSIIFDNQSFTRAPLWLTCLFTVVLAVLPIFWISRLPPFHSLLGIAVYMIAAVALVFEIANSYGVWISPTGLILALLLAYPLWSCVKVRRTQAAIDEAMQNLQDELARLGMEQRVESPHEFEDPQQGRIRKLASTARHLRDMHKSRSDALAFISHDIRSPLGAAILLVEKFEDNKYSARMKHLLERALMTADGFLQASRAEMSDVNKYQVLDMVSLVQQVLDDIYEMLCAKTLKLETDLPQEPIWVYGDFGLLFRAVSNVVLNAINYTPAGSSIRVGMEKEGLLLRLSVQDQGPGIPEDKLQHLFKRFSRAEGAHQDQHGSGLGLYFVGVTIRKHRGMVTAGNVNPHGAEFVITLPLERRKQNNVIAHDRRAKPEPTFEDTI